MAFATMTEATYDVQLFGEEAFKRFWKCLAVKTVKKIQSACEFFVRIEKAVTNECKTMLRQTGRQLR